jgi:hypothetical protein
VYHGSSSGVSSSASRTITGGAAYDSLGVSVSGAGDVNGDGYDDVVVGAYEYNSGSLLNAGAAYVHHGSSSGVSSSASRTITGGAASDSLGVSVSGAGDVNGDGYDDVIVGARYYDSGSLSEAGAAYVYHGSSSGVSSSASRTITGGAATDYLGFSVSGAGDVNGDGYDDVIVGAYGYNSGSLSDAGAAYVHHGYADEDGDGVYVGGDSSTPQDCDDADGSVGVASTRYVDADGDGYGSSATATACPSATGYADTSTDCDDTRADVSPGAPELCDAANTDEDCDGSADDADGSVAASGFSTWYADADADTFGAASVTAATCDVPAGYVADASDCDDTRADVSPAAPELCDASNTDEDCDGASDDADATVDASGFATWYADTDSDTFGSAAVTSATCDVPAGYVSDASDCDDSRADVSPAAPELCDAADTDEDCDGTADDADPTVDATGYATWYADADSDTFGNAAVTAATCDVPSGYVADASDCDDTRADVSPAGTEVSDDGVDQDCDGADAASAAGDDTGDDLSEDKAGGCGCTSASPDVSVLAMALALGMAVRRRRDGAAAR